MKLPKKLNINLNKFQDLRYGENPHQKGAYYVEGWESGFEKLWGIDLSYNNLEDANSAWRLVSDFNDPTVAIIKHGNPSGIASRNNLADAFKLALDADPVSAYGGIVSLNRPPTLELIEAMSGKFFELMVAPTYSKQVLERLKRRSEKMRVIRANPPSANLEIKRIFEGYLVQTPDILKETPLKWKVVSGKKPDKKTLADCEFANKIVKHVKSNAIVIAKNLNMVGVGIGQPNRVNSVNLATKQAGKKTKGAVLASDAFFPFDDNVKLAARAQVSVILQPGGSIRDNEVIATAKKLGMTMIFTGIRHFKH
ncbi:MAG: Bifunctional purine biosynthesis protein PurH [Candidatus Curtissbacteria bacterium GW2011_GWA1_41_11]|uniref:Bifunctional purine biosynthesis protein PurH n=1 Tax=Candidatus Curtissbacteria bacterium GW2011_GWA1_41_11 TaxID=1618409 RepID=A0A0G0UK78_9BACT|nr:MAG: Bifunctional purine biosynthesis protein PurH [Candidatus Curtissbacteria bacterium GW2011_GWA1_41_11]